MDDATLVSMKLPKTTKKEAMSYPSMKEPEYPWGLQLTLESEQLKALNLTTMPAVGETMTLTATVQVTSVSQYESKDNDEKRRSLGLQITELALR